VVEDSYVQLRVSKLRASSATIDMDPQSSLDCPSVQHPDLSSQVLKIVKRDAT
jgi:hypothetical protein